MAAESGAEGAAPAGRDRCPVCGARRGREPACRRCKTDLTLVLAVEARADAAYREALDSWRAGHFRLAAARAREAVRLEARPEHLRLLAASALRAGDFPNAVRAARRAGGGKVEAAAPSEGSGAEVSGALAPAAVTAAPPEGPAAASSEAPSAG